MKLAMAQLGPFVSESPAPGTIQMSWTIASPSSALAALTHRPRHCSIPQHQSRRSLNSLPAFSTRAIAQRPRRWTRQSKGTRTGSARPENPDGGQLTAELGGSDDLLVYARNTFRLSGNNFRKSVNLCLPPAFPLRCIAPKRS